MIGAPPGVFQASATGVYYLLIKSGGVASDVMFDNLILGPSDYIPTEGVSVTFNLDMSSVPTSEQGAYLAGGGTFRNEPSTAADLNETSLEQALIDIAGMTDERGLRVAARGVKMIIPSANQFNAERLMKSQGRTGTADNDINAVASMGMIPQGYRVNNFLTDTDSWYIITDVPNGMKMFQRAALKTAMEGDFDTGNVRYKARERYSFGVSDYRGIFGVEGA